MAGAERLQKKLKIVHACGDGHAIVHRIPRGRGSTILGLKYWRKNHLKKAKKVKRW